MSIISTLREFAAHRAANREFRTTRDILDGLPADIQKDIGYPARFERNRLRSRAFSRH